MNPQKFAPVVLLIAAITTASLRGNDVASYSVVKLHRFGQSSGADPVVDTRAYGGQFRVVPGTFVDDVQVTNSNSVDIPLNIDDPEASYEVTTKTINAINIAFPPGAFQFTIAAEMDGIVVATLTLPADDFPDGPRISNLPALQQAVVDSPIAVNWDAFGAKDVNDIIEFRLFDTGGTLVFTSGTLADDPHFDGTATGVEIPAGVLTAGTTYQADLRFLHVVDQNPTDYPGTLGIAALGSETVFPLITASGTSPALTIDAIVRLADGRIQIHFRGQPGLTYRIDQTSDFKQWDKLVDVVAPADGNAVGEDSASDQPARYYRVAGP